MARTLNPILLLPALGALALLGSAPAEAFLPAFRSPYPTGASIAQASRAAGLDAAPEQLFQRAVALGDLLEQSMPLEQRRARRLELALLLEGLGRRPDAAAFPWQDWVERCRQGHRKVGPGLLRAAAHALGDQIAPLADSFNRRDSPTELRIAALEALWRLDEMSGFNASAKALREPPRMELHEQLVDRVLRHCRGPRAEELLLDAISHSSPVAERAKRLAAELLGEWDCEDAIGLLGQILISERGNVELRKTAGNALFEIGTDEALRAIGAVGPIDASIEPVFHDYLRALRQQAGLPPRS